VRGNAHGYEITRPDEVPRAYQSKPHVFKRNGTWLFTQAGRVFFVPAHLLRGDNIGP